MRRAASGISAKGDHCLDFFLSSPDYQDCGAGIDVLLHSLPQTLQCPVGPAGMDHCPSEMFHKSAKHQ